MHMCKSVPVSTCINNCECACMHNIIRGGGGGGGGLQVSLLNHG